MEDIATSVISLDIATSVINLDIIRETPDPAPNVGKQEIMEEEEVWKSIPTMKGYEASSLGRIRKVGLSSRIIYQYMKGTYKYVTVNRKRHTVGRLVLFAFEGFPPTSEHTADHINRCRVDNRRENLRWATKSEQRQNQDKFDKRGNEVYRVDPITSDILDAYISATEASKLTGVPYESVLKSCQDKVVVTRERDKQENLFVFIQDVLKLEGEEWINIDSGRVINSKAYESNEIPVWEPKTHLKIKKYKISNYGRLQYKNNPPTIGSISGFYFQHCICDMKIPAHRLVAEYFLEKIEGKNVVNHKSGCKLDNHVDNLEYVTTSENAKHAHSIGLVDGTKRIVRINFENGEIAIFDTMEEAALQSDLTPEKVLKNLERGFPSKDSPFIWNYQRFPKKVIEPPAFVKKRKMEKPSEPVEKPQKRTNRESKEGIYSGPRSIFREDIYTGEQVRYEKISIAAKENGLIKTDEPLRTNLSRGKDDTTLVFRPILKEEYNLQQYIWYYTNSKRVTLSLEERMTKNQILQEEAKKEAARKEKKKQKEEKKKQREEVRKQNGIEKKNVIGVAATLIKSVVRENILTGEIVTYSSYRECAEANGVRQDNVSKVLTKTKGKPAKFKKSPKLKYYIFYRPGCKDEE